MTFPYQSSLLVLRWSGVCPIIITPGNEIKSSFIWQIWSFLVSTFILVSCFIRFYMYRNLRDDNFKYQFILQTISDLEPVFSFVLVVNVAWTNCYTPKLNQQVALLNQLVRRSVCERQDTRKWESWFLLRGLMTIIVLIIVVVVRYYIILSHMNAVSIKHTAFSLVLSYFLILQRVKFCFLLKLIHFEFKNINDKVQISHARDIEPIVVAFNKVLATSQLFESIFRSTIRFYLICTVFMFVTGYQAVQDVVTNAKDNTIDTLITAYWFTQSIPLFLWIIHTGESVQKEVRLT